MKIAVASIVLGFLLVAGLQVAPFTIAPITEDGTGASGIYDDRDEVPESCESLSSVPNFEDLPGYVSDVTACVGDLTQLVGKAGFGAIGWSFQQVGTVFEIISIPLETAGDRALQAKSRLEAGIAQTETATDSALSFVESIGNTGGVAGNIPIASDAYDGIKDLADQGGDTVSSAASTLTDLPFDILESFAGLFTAIGTLFTETGELLLQIEQIPGIIRDAVFDRLPSAEAFNVVSDTFEGMTNGLREFRDTITAPVDGIVDWIDRAFGVDQ